MDAGEGRREGQITPGSKFTRGTRFMNVELAALLDEQWERDQAS